MGIIDIPQEIWDHELTATAPAQPDWLWHGFVARRHITLLTSMWKSGKTTLLSLLLSRRKQGGSLAGLAVKPGKTVVVTEEDAFMWAERAHRLDFGGQVCFIHRPFLTVPGPEQWQALLDRILALHQQHGLDLAVFDPLAPFMRNENAPRNILDAMLPLAALTRRDMGVLMLHHPGKGHRPIGQAARGSGALPGHADISIEMRHPGGDPFTRRRRFFALSRNAETPRQLLFELNPEATDYVPVADSGDQFNWEPLTMILQDAPQKLTRFDILGEWPDDFDQPHPATLARQLNHLVDSHMILREGTGRKADPFRYWLPEREAVWKQDFLYEFIEQETKRLKLPFVSLTEYNRQSAANQAMQRRTDAAADRKPAADADGEGIASESCEE